MNILQYATRLHMFDRAPLYARVDEGEALLPLRALGLRLVRNCIGHGRGLRHLVRRFWNEWWGGQRSAEPPSLSRHSIPDDLLKEVAPPLDVDKVQGMVCEDDWEDG